MHTKKELDRRLALAGVRPHKKLGQNFLVNPRISARLIGAVQDFSPQTVIEVGPGLGALTDELIGMSFKTILIEIDSGIARFWKESAPQVPVFHQDALRFPWETFHENQPAIVVSNLPYSIAGPFVIEMSSLATAPVQGMVLMFQKEVAQRILSRMGSKDYGILSIIAQAHWEIEAIVDAGPQDFFPVPHVGSRVLRFTWKQTHHNRPAFLEFVKTAFAHRRKKLFSNLSGPFKRESLSMAFQQLQLSTESRAQDLGIQEFISLFGLLSTLGFVSSKKA